MGQPAYSYLYGSGFFNQADGFKVVHASGGGGGDSATLYDPAGGDTFVGQGNAATFLGSGYQIDLDTFAQVVAEAGGTNHKQVGALDYLFTALGQFS